ncbi:hypothetical protein D6D19_03535 [Aureobasidium pullulans]|uniref:Zn(2)-C6 fungal-type domain-containing protein n=1 Tax=Aureobasidium pullulans TaxID=5580 RepID=A0A4S9SX47_AURPU|nr:hypothetical protein D6D29_05770 [Aureobasidium pullulans]THV90820.1 hypothetical protein D6D26_09294 [Aureobasidium pullulans]THW19375.1 hypothetical protein D6D24_02873 [Aureobasidium pullulans]THW20558.1 hypothetical protein D6D23_06807 [Aureobasidium pullulans]THW41465.1 hypothetical protein D6D21_06335 [Aureobasidium pullulans]
MFLIIPKSRQQEETSRIIGTSGEREDVPESMPKHLRGPTRVQNACDECRIPRRRKVRNSSNSQCNGQNPCGRCRSRNTVCVFNFAEAKKRLKGPMTAAQASTLEAQQARVLDAIKNMSVVIDRLEASLSAATGKETIMEHDKELGARLANAEQDSGYDLNAILEKYAPIRQVSNNDSSVDLNHLETGEARSKRQRISHPENSGSLNPAIRPFDLPQTRTGDNLTPFTYEAFSQNNLGDLAGNVDNPFELRPLEQMNPRFCNQMDTQYPHNTHASCIAPPRSTDRSLNPLAFSITDRSEESNPNCDANQPGDSTVLSPSLETFFLQCQDMDTLIESIDWDMSRAVSARLLKDTEKSS